MESNDGKNVHNNVKEEVPEETKKALELPCVLSDDEKKAEEDKDRPVPRTKPEEPEEPKQESKEEAIGTSILIDLSKNQKSSPASSPSPVLRRVRTTISEDDVQVPKPKDVHVIEVPISPAASPKMHRKNNMSPKTAPKKLNEDAVAEEINNLEDKGKLGKKAEQPRTKSLLRFGSWRKSSPAAVLSPPKEKKVQIEAPEKPVTVANAKVDDPNAKEAPTEEKKTLRRADSSIGRFLNLIAEKIGGREKSNEIETKLHNQVLNHHHARFPFKGTAEDHPMEHSKRSAFRIFFVLTTLLVVIYSVDSLFETILYDNIFWWLICWMITLYMNLAYLLFLSNFWWRSVLKGDQYPIESRPVTGNQELTESNRYIGSVVLTIMPIAGENVDMVKKHVGAVLDSSVRGLHRDYLVVADDFRTVQLENGKEVPCLSHNHPTSGFEEPFLYQPKPFDPKYLRMVHQLAQEKGMNRKQNLSYMAEDGTGYVLCKFFGDADPQKAIFYMARNKYDNAPSMLKGENLNTAMSLPDVKDQLTNPPSGHSFVFIVDARHCVKPEFKAGLLQYFWSYNPETKQWVFHDKLASVQAQHWYPNIPNGHPLQPNNRFFFDGVMKGRTFKGSVPNAGTMNVFQYKALYGIDPERPDEARFSIYTVTEDKASEIEYFGRGYYALFHPYLVTVGVPADSIAKEFDRLLRWARGNFAIFIEKNPIKNRNGMEMMHRLWAIEGTFYPVNGCVTLFFYFACILYIGTGVTFLTFHSITVLVFFLALMLCGRICYLLSVPTMTQDDMWANMQAWLNVMPVYVWSVLTCKKGYAKNAVWVPTGSKVVTDGMIIQWVVVLMQVINISAMVLGAGMMLGQGYPHMWTFFARMGLGIMLVVMQKDVVKQILIQNGIIRKDMRLGPVVLFTLFIIVGLIFCVGWEFDEEGKYTITTV